MKKVLQLFDDFDFSLIGLSCHAKDYRLSWEINRALDIDLTKMHTNDGSGIGMFTLSASSYFNEETHIEYVLATNNNSGDLLIPEHPKLDYIMKIDGPMHESEASACKAVLKEIDVILAVIEINTATLKSKSNLIF